jgi:hypothetical protein
VVDVQLAHPGALHHGIEGDEVLLHEAQQVDQLVFHGGLGFSESFEALEVRQQAEGHHLKCLGVVEVGMQKALAS